MSRQARKTPRRRSLLPAASRPSIRWILLAIAFPLLAVLAWFGARFVLSTMRSAPSVPAVTAAPDATAAPRSPMVETPRVERVLLDAGIDRDRLRWDNGDLLVETFDTEESVLEIVRRGLPGSIVSSDGDVISVAHGDDDVERLRIVRLQRGTEFDGFTPADAAAGNAIPRAPVTGARKIVLILDDVGFENQPLESAASIDARISFAVIPGTPRAVESAEFLASRGFEILCHLPMEPIDYPSVSPGRHAIFTSMPDEEIRAVTEANIASIPHVKGVNNHMGSRATKDRRVMQNVADVLLQRGIYFVDSRTAGSSVAAQVTREASIPTGTRDVFLDDDPSEEAVRRQVKLLARLSDSRDYVIGIGHVYPTTIRVLRQEIPKLAEAGYEFLFVSDVLR